MWMAAQTTTSDDNWLKATCGQLANTSSQKIYILCKTAWVALWKERFWSQNAANNVKRL